MKLFFLLFIHILSSLGSRVSYDDVSRSLQIQGNIYKFSVVLTKNNGNEYESNVHLQANRNTGVFTKAFVTGNPSKNILTQDPTLLVLPNAFDSTYLSCPVTAAGVTYTHDDKKVKVTIYRGLLFGSCKFYVTSSDGRINIRGNVQFTLLADYSTTSPTLSPSYIPTITPSIFPSSTPSESPSYIPTIMPSETPTITPSITPTETPTQIPSDSPTLSPTIVPSFVPTFAPTGSGIYTLKLEFQEYVAGGSPTSMTLVYDAIYINNQFISIYDPQVMTNPRIELLLPPTPYGAYITGHTHKPDIRNCPLTASGIGVDLVFTFDIIPLSGTNTFSPVSNVNVYYNSDGCKFGDGVNVLGTASFTLTSGMLSLDSI